MDLLSELGGLGNFCGVGRSGNFGEFKGSFIGFMEATEALNIPGSPLSTCPSEEELDEMEPERDEVESNDDRLLIASCMSPARVWNDFLLRLRAPSKAEELFSSYTYTAMGDNASSDA